MNAAGKVEFRSRRSDFAAKRQQIQFVGNRKLLDLPAEFARSREIIAQDLFDINGLAEVTAFVPAEALDGMRHDGKLPGRFNVSTILRFNGKTGEALKR